MRPRLALLLLLALAACLDLAPDADLEGPRVVGGDLVGPRALEVPVQSTLTIALSEPLDPARVRVALLAWETVGACELTPTCEVGGCERGRCQTDPVDDAARAALLDGEPGEGAIEVAVELLDSDDGTGSLVQVTPRRPLAPHARHSLLLFARDRRGAPLVGADGQAAVWRADFVSAGEGSSGPEPRLVSPPPGADGVPTDLARVETAFAIPVRADAAATLRLRAGGGEAIDLVDPRPCAGWVPDLCLSWRTARPLAPATAYQLGGGRLRDRAGRSALDPGHPAWFRTGAGPDLEPPDLSGLEVFARGRCLHARLPAREPLHLRLEAGEAWRELVAAAGALEIGVPLVGAPGEVVAVRVRATDLSGQDAERLSEHVLGGSFDPAAPPLAIVEVLADPRGREPAQEFVELVDLRAAGDALVLTDLRLADAEGDAGDPLPAFTSRPGQRHLVVAAGYDPAEGADPAPPADASLVRVDASLARGGLKNAPGEPVLLVWGAGPEGPVPIGSYGGWLDPAPGRSALADAGACDTPSSWRSHPGGSASPGAPP